MLKMHWNNNAHWLVYNIIIHSALVPSALAVYSPGIKQIHRPGGAMYRPIQGHKWQWHHEWRRVSSKSHEWCHWHEWPCIGWYIPHPGQCISNPLWKHNHLWCIAYHPWCIVKYITDGSLHKRLCIIMDYEMLQRHEGSMVTLIEA